MEFCPVCNNMLYVKTDENKNLVKYCRHCDYNRIDNHTSAVKICETIYSEDDLLFNQHVNKYLPMDNTLRRINDPIIKCTNPECISNTEEGVDQQVIYIKYHHENMKYLYCCDRCSTIWR